MTTAKEIVMFERDELNEKLSKLKDFLLSDKFLNLSESHKALLKCQLEAMTVYLNCLTTRLEIWK